MKIGALLLVPALLLMSSLSLCAGDFAALKEEIVTARKALVTFVIFRDRRGPEYQKLVKDTAETVSARIARLKPPSGKESEFRELKETWSSFKNTREAEQVPAILAGDREKSERIGTGIQKARIDRMYFLIDFIEK